MSRRGFTLVELLLVVTIMAILATAIFPRLGATVRRTRLDEGGERLAAYLQAARELAVRRGLRVEWKLNRARNAFSIQIQEAGQTERYVAAGEALWESPQYLPPGVTIAKVEQQGQRSDVRRLVLMPDGVAEPVTLHVGDIQGRKGEVRLGTWADDVVYVRTANEAEGEFRAAHASVNP